MKDSFVAYFERFSQLSTQVKSSIRGISTRIDLPKNEMLLKQGERCKSIYLVMNGLARVYYYLEGKEITNQFFFEQDVIADMESLYSKKRSLYNIQLLEECCLVEINYAELEHLYTQYHELESVGRLIAIECFLEENERNRFFQMYTAEDRYKMLLKKQPGILNRVNLGHISSYIGVTQVQLSRIRAKQASF